MISISRVARRYGAALFLEARQQDKLDDVFNDVQSLNAAFAENASFRLFLANPIVGRARKREVLTRVLKPVLSTLSFNFCMLLNSKDRDAELESAAAAFEEQYNELKGIVKATIRSAMPADADQQRAIEAKILEYTGHKRVIASFQTDSSLIGGFTVQVGHMMLDGSIKRQLDRLRSHLNESNVSGSGSSLRSNGRAAG